MRSPGHGGNRGDVIQDRCSLAPTACPRARELGNTPGRRRLHLVASSPKYGCGPGSPGYAKLRALIGLLSYDLGPGTPTKLNQPCGLSLNRPNNRVPDLMRQPRFPTSHGRQWTAALWFERAVWASANAGDSRACFPPFPLFGRIAPGGSVTVRGDFCLLHGRPAELPRGHSCIPKGGTRGLRSRAAATSTWRGEAAEGGHCLRA